MLMYGYEFLDMCVDLVIDGHEFLGFYGIPCLIF